jgi:hypothetical protein
VGYTPLGSPTPAHRKNCMALAFSGSPNPMTGKEPDSWLNRHIAGGHPVTVLVAWLPQLTPTLDIRRAAVYNYLKNLQWRKDP